MCLARSVNPEAAAQHFVDAHSSPSRCLHFLPHAILLLLKAPNPLYIALLSHIPVPIYRISDKATDVNTVTALLKDELDLYG